MITYELIEAGCDFRDKAYQNDGKQFQIDTATANEILGDWLSEPN